MKAPAGRRHDSARPVEMPGMPWQAPGFIRANLGVIVLVTIAVMAGAALVSWSRTPLFTSEAEVMVQPKTYTTGAAAQLPDMATEKALASSGTVLGNAAETLAVPERQLAEALSITVPVDTRVLRIDYAHPDPSEARRRAEGIAQAYVADANRDEAAGQPHAVIITAASLPLAPTSPNHAIDLAVGLVLGLALGVGVALARDRLDDRFRSLSEFEAHVGAPVLGVIPAVSRSASRSSTSLVAMDEAVSDAADAYRDVRTRLLQIAGDRGAKTLLVASPAGADKAAVAANLAALLTVRGRDVALVCAEVRPRDMFERIGVESKVGLAELVDDNLDLAQALCVTSVGRLRVVTAGGRVRDPGAMLQSETMKRTLSQLRDSFDFTVIMAPPVLSFAGTGILAESADMVLLVGDAGRSTRAEVSAATRQLEASRERLVGCIMDNVRRRRRSRWMWRRPKPRPTESLVWVPDSRGTVRSVRTMAAMAPAGRLPGVTEEAADQFSGRRPSPGKGSAVTVTRTQAESETRSPHADGMGGGGDDRSA
jgi:tyrosine-protein kinase